jgi:hypothetical protein
MIDTQKYWKKDLGVHTNKHSNLFKQAQLIIEFLGIWMTLKFKCTFCSRSSVIWVSLLLN